MKQTATPPKRVRLSPEARERAILESAIRFFAENGFGGQTRELAQSIDVSQALIFRYFPTKEDLIERVYEEVFSRDWKPNLALLVSEGLTIEARLTTFYRDYAARITRHDYTRLLLFAALNQVNFHKRLFRKIASDIYPAVIDELRAAYGKTSTSRKSPTQAEIEAVWGLHASIFFLGIREHVFGLPVPPLDESIALKVRTFLAGVPAILNG